MKGKITIVLLSLVLVFGMIAASCDNGDFSDNPYRNQTGNDTKKAKDWIPSDFVVPRNVEWDTAPGITSGIGVQGKAKITGDVIDLKDTSDSALFTLAIPGATVLDTITIKYIVKVTTGEPKVTLKNPDWSDASAPSQYITLTKDKADTLELKGAWYKNAANIAFQRNGDSNSFEIKILNVEVE